MTGQIPPGGGPWEAAKYQLLVAFLLAGTNGPGGGAWRRMHGHHPRLGQDRPGPAR